MKVFLIVFLMAFAAEGAPVPLTTIDVKVTGGTEKQRLRLQGIALKLGPVINSAEFQKRVLGAYFDGKPGFESSSRTPKFVLDSLLKSDEFKKGKPDRVWQYDLQIKRLAKGTLGSMFWPKAPIYFNSMYLDNRSDSGLAGTFCHEKMHQLGFVHAKAKTATRKYSVPYAIGNLCAEMYRKWTSKK